MVKITRLRLKNFKSFRKANLPIHRGFTSIVGSNASGKSNILDALLFVFGETSLKMLRAGKLSELVNHDAEENYAKVEVEVEHDGKHFEIARLIDKQGRGIVKLDGKKKSLGEVTALLQEIGLQAGSHNVVVQGDITRVIEMSHKERRQIIEEIAGLSEFEEKKQEALKKLEDVEKRVREVEIVLKEREAYLQKLEADRNAAMRYNDLTKELQMSKGTIFAEEIRRIKEELAVTSKKVEGAQVEVQRKDGERKEVSDELKGAEAKLEEINAKLLKASEEIYATFGSELQQKRGELKVADFSISAKKEKLDSAGKKLGLLRQRIAEYEKTVSDKDEMQKDLGMELQELRKKLEPFEKDIKCRAEKLKEEKKKLKVEEEAFEKLQHEISSKLRDLHKNEVLLAELQKEISLAVEHLKLLEEEEKKLGVPQKKKKLAEVRQMLASVEKELEKLKAQKEVREQAQKLLAAQKELSAQVGELESFLKEFSAEAKRAAYENRKKHSETRLAETEKAKQKISAELEKLNKAKAETEQKLRQGREGKAMLEEGALSSELAELQQRRNEIEVLIASAKAESGEVRKRLHEAKAEIAELEKLESTEQHSLKELETQKQKFEKEIAELETKMEKASKSNKMLEEEKQRFHQKTEKLSAKRDEIDEKLDALEKRLNEQQIENSKNEVRLGDLQEEYKNFEGVELFKGANVANLRNRLPQIEKELKQIGAVNLKALEGFEEYKKEVEDIRSKANKLDEERKVVLEMIDKVEVKKLQVFMDCFNEINHRFQQLYYNFFEGEGRLGLTEPTNPLAGGLTIEAKYKGEKLKSIDAMSGGEKSLTALAFLFAIQSYSASPFYLFDEVDAALDKDNSAKLARMMKEISKKSQLVAITHNDVIIKQADQLIGVALNKQKSSVIGLKLEGKLEDLLKEEAEVPAA